MRYTIQFNDSFRMYVDTLTNLQYYVYDILQKIKIKKIIDNWTGQEITLNF